MIVALCHYRNGAAHIRQFVQHLDGYVDRVVLLDDRSRDGSHLVWKAAVPRFLETLRPCCRVHDAEHAYESEDRLLLLQRAIQLKADWVLALDVDMRCEREFLRNLPFWTGQLPAHPMIYSLRMRDLWNSEYQYRTDGPWATKRLMALFPCPKNTDLIGYYPSGTLHAPWVPEKMRARVPVMPIDFNIYHLGMQTINQRAERVAKFRRIDPDHHFQGDYGYLSDESNLTVERIPEGKEWR